MNEKNGKKKKQGSAVDDGQLDRGITRCETGGVIMSSIAASMSHARVKSYPPMST